MRGNNILFLNKYKKPITLTGKPLNDEDATWNEKDRRYVLTKDYIKKKLNINLTERYASAQEVENFLDEVSTNFYLDVYELSTTYNATDKRDTHEYVLAKRLDIRRAIIRGLLLYCRWSLRSDGDIKTDYNEAVKMPSRIITDMTSSGVIEPGEFTFIKDPEDNDWTASNESS